ncbi:TetR/AcrR family transcriptional regulator, partial [Enterococcus faecalis]
MKREAILENARNVFSRQGLIDVTMQDIIDECQISRGGLYLYFDSVDAIFMEVVNQHACQTCPSTV